MKELFIGYYDPTSEEIDNAWNNGTFAFDANTLLNLYRYTPGTRKDFLKSLKTFKGRLFLPYQAALEFHHRRINVINGLENDYQELLDFFERDHKEKISNKLNEFKRHPSIQIERIHNLYNKLLININKELDNQRANHPDFKLNNEVLDEITELFDNSVGEQFSDEELANIKTEGSARYKKNIPPGYKDLNKSPEKGDPFGDYVIWLELQQFAQKNKTPITFVTDDRKEDWWRKDEGKTIRPREELIKEFYDNTGIRILIYNADQFLHFAKERKFSPKLNETTIEEVKRVRELDERFQFRSDFLKRINESQSSWINSLNNLPKWNIEVPDTSYLELLRENTAKISELYGPIINELYTSANMANLYKTIPSKLDWNIPNSSISILEEDNHSLTETPESLGDTNSIMDEPDISVKEAPMGRKSNKVKKTTNDNKNNKKNE